MSDSPTVLTDTLAYTGIDSPPANAFQLVLKTAVQDARLTNAASSILRVLFNTRIDPPARSGLYLVVSMNFAGWSQYDAKTNLWSFVHLSYPSADTLSPCSIDVARYFPGHHWWLGLSSPTTFNEITACPTRKTLNTTSSILSTSSSRSRKRKTK